MKELLIKTLFESVFWQKKKGKKRYSTEAFPIIFVSRKYMSCQLHSFPGWISLTSQLLILKYLNVCSTQVS